MAIKTKFSIIDRPVFPHIKLTNEPFPRALATRILQNDDDEYFGAFLSRTNVRILMDFLNRTFRLRTCAIDIDGSFNVPCTQYHARRCVGPCVESLCDHDAYLEMVNLGRLFLRNQRELFQAALARKVDTVADALDFETAAFFRDILEKVEWFWSQPRYQVWLDDTVDTIDLHADDEAVYVIVLSQRGRRSLGEIVYAFAALDDPPRALHAVIDQFYKFHLPRAIRVSHDFDGRAALARKLATSFDRKINISVAADANRRVTAERGIDMAKARLELDRRKHRQTLSELQKEVQRTFGLSETPHRIEAFDVAHISATGFAAAVAIWEAGKELPEEYEHWVSDETSELDTLRAFIAKRRSHRRPNLLVVDGGTSHLKAAMDAAGETFVVAAVKPRTKHSSISHFLTSAGDKIAFDPDAASHRLMHRLRDDAHDLANATHRLGRDMLHFYELAAILPSLNEGDREELLRDLGSIRRITALDAGDLKERFGGKKGERAARDLVRFHSGKSPKPQPLIVPIRFVETDGAAEDLIPIDSR